jgi:protein-tyrosine phosphatase
LGRRGNTPLPRFGRLAHRGRVLVDSASHARFFCSFFNVLSLETAMQSLSRHLALQGASNFRDLGGYPAHGGRRVRWRVLFRSDHLANLTSADLAQLQSLNIGRSFDFRGQRESAAQAYDWPGTQRHPLAIEPTLVQYLQTQAQSGQPITPEAAADAMQVTYQGFVRSSSERFAQLFAHLLAADTPLVFHCTAGKDRTGLAAALILSALGVSQEDIVQDYLLTNALYRREAAHSAPLSPEVMDVVWRVREAFLDAALQAIDQDYGSMARYLEVGLGVDAQSLDRLRERYLD